MRRYGDPSGDIDDLLSLLANSRRRILIRYLTKHESAPLRDIAEVIADIEDAKTSYIYVNLYQTHAPKLADFDVVAYSQQAKSVSRGPQFDRCVQLLNCADSL